MYTSKLNKNTLSSKNILASSLPAEFVKCTFKNIFKHSWLAEVSLNYTLEQVNKKPLMPQVIVQKTKCSEILRRVKQSIKEKSHI